MMVGSAVRTITELEILKFAELKNVYGPLADPTR